MFSRVGRNVLVSRSLWRVPVVLRTNMAQVAPRVPLVRYNNTASFQADNPQLMIAFTCKKCDTRSSHTFSRQSYYKGSVLIQCPGCKNRHLIADNLKIFHDNNFNLEDVLGAKGESVATGTEDLAFEDIPESLKKTLGHYAKDAPEEYQRNDTDDLPKEIEAKKD